VVPRHGRLFAKLLCAESLQSEIPSEVFGLTGVIEWPQECEDDTPAKIRYGWLQDQILWRTLNEAEEAIADAFVRVATDVLERERSRDRRP
jgi:hypothetical protein